MFSDKGLVNKNASGSRINEGSYKESLEGDHSFESDRKI